MQRSAAQRQAPRAGLPSAGPRAATAAAPLRPASWPSCGAWRDRCSRGCWAACRGPGVWAMPPLALMERLRVRAPGPPCTRLPGGTSWSESGEARRRRMCNLWGSAPPEDSIAAAPAAPAPAPAPAAATAAAPAAAAPAPANAAEPRLARVPAGCCAVSAAETAAAAAGAGSGMISSSEPLLLVRLRRLERLGPARSAASAAAATEGCGSGGSSDAAAELAALRRSSLRLLGRPSCSPSSLGSALLAAGRLPSPGAPGLLPAAAAAAPGPGPCCCCCRCRCRRCCCCGRPPGGCLLCCSSAAANHSAWSSGAPAAPAPPAAAAAPAAATSAAACRCGDCPPAAGASGAWLLPGLRRLMPSKKASCTPLRAVEARSTTRLSRRPSSRQRPPPLRPSRGRHASPRSPRCGRQRLLSAGSMAAAGAQTCWAAWPPRRSPCRGPGLRRSRCAPSCSWPPARARRG
jgi:hypothetical protein